MPIWKIWPSRRLWLKPTAGIPKCGWLVTKISYRSAKYIPFKIGNLQSLDHRRRQRNLTCQKLKTRIKAFHLNQISPYLQSIWDLPRLAQPLHYDGDG